jgi:hypothetical protein
MRGSRILTGAVIAAVAVALPAGTAFGQGSLDVNPERAAPGQTVTVTAMGCGGQGVGSTTAALATFNLTPVPGSRPLVVTGTFQVKDNARAGEYTVRVSCPQLADPGSAPDPHLAQELFSQVTVGGATRTQRDAPAGPKAVPGTGRTNRSGGDEWSDPYGEGDDDPQTEGRESRQSDPYGSLQDEGAKGGQDKAYGTRQDESADSPQEQTGNGHQDERGSRREETGGGRQEKNASSGAAGQEGYTVGSSHQRPHSGIGGQAGGWSHQGPHTGVGGAFGMDAGETAAGAALLAATAAGGVYLVRRRARRGAV